MEKRIIHCNTKDVLYLTLPEKSNGLEMILVDTKNVPIARYGFDMEKLKGVNSISYHSNNIRIHFDDIKPTSLSELDTVVD
jgi:hypothetical protein